MIITKGYGDDQMIITQGYGTLGSLIGQREVLRLESEIHPTMEVESHYGL